jgi:FkbM family methyltransferase
VNLRKRIKKWLYGSCPGIAGSFPYFGAKVYFPKGSLNFLAACIQGVYENANVRLLASLVKPATTFLDVGAHIGLMSLPVLKAVQDAQVVAFEASPTILPYLRQTIERSPYHRRWKLVPVAVGAQIGPTVFSLSSTGNSVFDGLKSTNRVPMIGDVEVEMTTIDSWWRKSGSPQISVIKIDVEGAELQVLEGARQCLAEQRPRVLLEWVGQNLAVYGYDASALLDFAEASGNGVYALPHLVRVNSARELELQMAMTESFLLEPEEPSLGH